jgi:hypothetical protein
LIRDITMYKPKELEENLAVDFVKKNLTKNGEVVVNGVVYKLNEDQ